MAQMSYNVIWMPLVSSDMELQIDVKHDANAISCSEQTLVLDLLPVFP